MNAASGLHARTRRPEKKRWIVMAGCDPQAPGGISSTLRTLLRSGLPRQWPIRMLVTWRSGSITRRGLTAAAALLTLTGWLACGRVQALHAHVAAYGSFWRKALLSAPAFAAGVPVMLHVHDGRFLTWFESQSALSRGLIRAVLRQADRVLALDEIWREQIERIAPGARVEVLCNPVESPPLNQGHLRARPITPENPAQILFMSRLWPEKGIDDLLQAAVIVQRQNTDVHWTLAGDGDLQALRNRIRILGLSDRVSVPGWLDEDARAAALSNSHLLVLPSHAEGQPVAVLEAMAAGVPVVATSVGGLPSLLSDDAGLLVPPRDPVRLAGALMELLGDPRRRLRIAQQARERIAQRHEAHRVAARLGHLYTAMGLQPTEVIERL